MALETFAQVCLQALVWIVVSKKDYLLFPSVEPGQVGISRGRQCCGWVCFCLFLQGVVGGSHIFFSSRLLTVCVNLMQLKLLQEARNVAS